MSDKSQIEWTDATWNPVTGCSKVSPGCAHCYAEATTKRYAGRPGWIEEHRPWTPKNAAHNVRLHPERLEQPLHWKEPRRVFVNSMSDLFHEDVPDGFIAEVFAVMALTPRHTYQVLTKRPERMRAYASDLETPFRVAKAMDALTVAQEIAALGPEEERPIGDYPGYFVTNYGRVLSSNGSAACLFCGGPVEGLASKAYCSKKCKQNANFYRRTGRAREGARTLTEMKPAPGEEGHSRVMLYVNGQSTRELVHRLVLTAFVRPPEPGEQGCHRNGDATNNALPNLRWGTQSSNWSDRKRHGNAHAHGDRYGVEAPIAWPLQNCWKGVSVENQHFADERIPLLLQTPAAIRFISAEPMLGPIELRDEWLVRHQLSRTERRPRIEWVIVGGESGRKHRRMELPWAINLRMQCRQWRVAYFGKQNSGARPGVPLPSGMGLGDQEFPQ